MPTENIKTVLKNLSYQGKSTLLTVFVVSDLKTNLLGMPAITSLTFATRIDLTETGVGQQDYRNSRVSFGGWLPPSLGAHLPSLVIS